MAAERMQQDKVRLMNKQDGATWEPMSNNLCTEVSSVSEEIEEFLVQYQAAFESLDASAIANFWCAPTWSFERNVVLVGATPAEIRAISETAVTVLKANNVRYAIRNRGEIRVMTENLIEVPVHWSLFDQHDQLIKQLRNVYVLRRVDGAWKISVAYLLE
jgi:hypothetical protein